jgi:hypothetical protein
MSDIKGGNCHEMVSLLLRARCNRGDGWWIDRISQSCPTGDQCKNIFRIVSTGRRLEGRLVGELTPASEAIPDLDKAARNSRGMVEYSSRIVIVMPTDPMKGNGALLIDVPNRGRPISHALFNSPRDLPMLLGPIVDQGTGFLEDHGYILAAPSWELGQGADLPKFTDSDGGTRYVEGVGFAIIRDTPIFLRPHRRTRPDRQIPLQVPSAVP